MDDLRDVPEEVKDKLEIRPVENVDEALEICGIEKSEEVSTENESE